MARFMGRLIAIILGRPGCGHRVALDDLEWCVECWLQDAASL